MGGMVLHVYEPRKWKEIVTESKENNQSVPVPKQMPMLLINCVLSVLKGRHRNDKPWEENNQGKGI